MKKTLYPFIFLLTFFFSTSPTQAQLLTDPAGIRLIQQGIDHIYNYEFEEATRVGQQVKARYPNHPVGYMLKAFQMYWQYLPIQTNKAKAQEYQNTLNQCLVAVEKQYGKESTNPEAVFFTMAAHGYRALMFNYQKELIKAATEAQSAYSAMMNGMKLTDRNPEFYFTTGMYNYYVEVYPNDHPIVKPIMVFFKNGNKPLGLKQVDTATRVGVITRAEACYYLAHIYLEHESQPERALAYSSKLNSWYPQNPVYKILHTEALLLAGRYAEATDDVNYLKRYSSGFYPIAWHTFQGILEEKKEKDDAQAQREYLAALRTPYDEQFTREYHAMAFAGLARIADRAGNKAQAKSYYKKCLEVAQYKSQIREAKAYLK
ncbi:ABC transporter substrate-binding protein [Telluribacter sp.]|jgi:tetratricopeptide (TPR) repeat protein|uniref:tetratricopeptide repeat protein n=1 Tax=Telluribacter sp. TaxID=1978767 RepID=UPI002E13545A|nr:ABC transporter substrate-binding protein [Telluribacter sp.]